MSGDYLLRGLGKECFPYSLRCVCVCLCVRVGFSSYNIAGGLFAQLGTAINTHSLSLSGWRFRVY